MSTTIRPAREDDVARIVALVAEFTAANLMLPRDEANIRRTLDGWLVAVDDAEPEPVVGCGSLVALSDTLVEVRSLAVAESQHGKGLGSRLVQELVDEARRQGYAQVCALTLRASFFTRLGFQEVDRWSISPKVWQACIYCPKFHRCDEVAVLMNLQAEQVDGEPAVKTAGWNKLLKYGAWQPLKLAYQRNGQGDPAPTRAYEDRTH